jgi:integrase
MKKTYRSYQRAGTYYYQHNVSGEQRSLKTKSKSEAEKMLHAMNEAVREQALNRSLAEVYLRASDPCAATRTWKHLMDEGEKLKKGPTLTRWNWAMKSKSLDSIRDLKLIETRAGHFVDVLAKGTVSTNVFLRRLHNMALDMDWLSRPILPKKRWPKVSFKQKRGVTVDEYRKIVAGELNPEWRGFYELAWYLGASQTDIAKLCAENVDWAKRVVSYVRQKSGKPCRIRFGDEVSAVLKQLPDIGPLFPSLRKMKESDRGIAFTRRCKLVGVTGVTLHCFRYAWAERARIAGYPQRAAEEALGQTKAIHLAYSKNAQPNVPDLETFARTNEKVLKIEFAPLAEANGAMVGPIEQAAG